MSTLRLRERTPETIQPASARPVTDEAHARAAEIVAAVRERGDEAVLEYARQFNELRDNLHRFSPEECHAARERITPKTRSVLDRCAGRVGAFASAQRGALTETAIAIPGGSAGHRIIPVRRAGCYVPGGRYPLVSSLLMSVVTARAAGVAEVWVATPRPTDDMLAAAAIAGASGVIGVGGAHGIAALAFGFSGVGPCDCIVGPGNSYVTAAKFLVSSQVRIDMLAGPSELLVIADDSASPVLVAADLLAQAEHDSEAVPILVSTSRDLVEAVQSEIEQQTAALSSATTIAEALGNGFFSIVSSLEEAARISNSVAPEHLQLSIAKADEIVPLLENYGGLFIGEGSAEVIGDYCAGPNHVLPTGGTGRFRCGLSVFDFLKVATWLRVDNSSEATELYDDAVSLAEVEGLPGHRQAAWRRLGGDS